MEGISAGISQIVILALVVFLGFILAKLDFIDEHTSNKLVGLLINVTLPCMIIASTSSVEFDQIANQIPLVCGLGIVLFGFMAVVSVFACVLLRVSRDTVVCYIFSGICTQTAFIGVPVIAAVLGESTVILTSLIVAIINVFLFSVGIAMLVVDQQLRETESTHASGENRKFSFSDALSRVSLSWKNFVNPALVAAILALLFLFFRIPLPYVLDSAFDMVGSLTATISMLVIGFYVSRMRVKESLSQWRVFVFGFIRFFLGSVALFYMLSLVVPDTLIVSIAVLEFAMPTGAMVPAFIASHKGDAMLASEHTVISAVLSFVYLPGIIAIMALFPL
ncbi:MAG: AEC family transporter [Eggerthellaceae bacterium]|nr:AEC family transporter [Eggerthellaceae bacterium]